MDSTTSTVVELGVCAHCGRSFPLTLGGALPGHNDVTRGRGLVNEEAWRTTRFWRQVSANGQIRPCPGTGKDPWPFR